MPELSYREEGLVLQKGATEATEQQIRDLQRDLRALGYLRSGVDGNFGDGTERAVKGLQYDLVANDGTSTQADGTAPVRIMDYNKGRVTLVNGQVDQPTVECISDILDDSSFPALPFAQDPVQENAKVVSHIEEMSSADVPIPFLMAILKQESDLKQFNVPGPGDQDTYVVVGLDTKDRAHPERITSRGYGVGQYTLFHHPPTTEEVNELMVDVDKNVQKTIDELDEKFNKFVNGSIGEARADDRIAEFGNGPLRLCKYPTDDARYIHDCKHCAADAGTINIEAGVTPLFEGSTDTYEPTQYYPSASYSDVPIRQNFGCDWPYAARRYNGSGVNSYHYQVRILKNLAG